MNEDYTGNAQRFLAGSEAAPPDADLLRAALEQRDATRRRRLPRMRLLVAAAAVTVGATGGVTAALLAAPGSHAPSALVTVTGALAKTSAESYSFSLDTMEPSPTSRAQPIVVSGAFDPRNGLGTELLTTRRAKSPVRMQIRFIGKYVYTWLSPGSGLGTIGEPWDKAPVPTARADGMPMYDVYGFVTDRPVSPAELSRVLRSAGTVRDQGPASGAGWIGTKYAFSARLPGGRESVSGIMYVDQQGQVRRLVTITTQGRLTTDRDLTFTDFGAPVPVTAPAPSQVQYTSTPYWGFFF
jgi:hypothetical protein